VAAARHFSGYDFDALAPKGSQPTRTCRWAQCGRSKKMADGTAPTVPDLLLRNGCHRAEHFFDLTPRPGPITCCATVTAGPEQSRLTRLRAAPCYGRPSLGELWIRSQMAFTFAAMSEIGPSSFGRAGVEPMWLRHAIAFSEMMWSRAA
jgi:hypothetical protein